MDLNAELQRLWQHLSGLDVSGNDPPKRMLLSYAQTSVGSDIALHIKGIVTNALRERGYLTHIVYAVSTSRMLALKQRDAELMTYDQFTSLLSESWDTETGRAMPFTDESETSHDMVIFLDHDDLWSLDYAIMMVLLVRRLEWISKNVTDATFVRVLLLGTAPQMDIRVHNLIFNKNEDKVWPYANIHSFNLTSNDEHAAKGVVYVDEGKVVEYLTRNIVRSKEKNHLIFCFQPFERLDALIRRKPGIDESTVNSSGPTVYFDARAWEKAVVFSDVGRSEVTRGFQEYLLDTGNVRGPDAKTADHLVMLALMENASGTVWPSMVPNDYVVWVVVGKTTKQVSLDRTLRRVVFDATDDCSREEREAQLLLARGVPAIVTDQSSTAVSPRMGTHRLEIEHERLADFICLLGYYSSLDDDIDAWKAIKSLIHRTDALAEVVRRLTYQGIVSYAPSDGRLLPRMRPCSTVLYDHRLSRLLDSTSPPNMQHSHIAVVKVMLVTVMLKSRHAIVLEKEVQSAAAAVGLETMASTTENSCSLLSDLAIEGTLWLTAALGSKPISWKVDGDDRKRLTAMAYAVDHPENLCRIDMSSIRDGGAVNAHVMIDGNSLYSTYHTAMTLARELKVPLEPAEIQKLMASGGVNGPRLGIAEKDELYRQLLDSFLFDLVYTTVAPSGQSGVHLETRMHLTGQLVQISGLIRLMMRAAWKKECNTTRMKGKKKVVVFGICPSVRLIDGAPTLMEWIWVPAESVIRWHRALYPDEIEMLKGARDEGWWE